MATTIDTQAPVLTLINVFTVEPSQQQELVDLLTEATEALMSKLDGYISANLHTSLDGTKVTNYAQWRDQAAFDAMLHNQEAGKHMKRISEIAHAEPTPYKVVYSDHI